MRSARGAKFDAIAAEVAFYLLKNGMILRYQELLDLIENDPARFFTFNDSYFMTILQNHYSAGSFKKDKGVLDICLLYTSPSPRDS